jgi:hypothetical protein
MPTVRADLVEPEAGPLAEFRGLRDGRVASVAAVLLGVRQPTDAHLRGITQTGTGMNTKRTIEPMRHLRDRVNVPKTP